MQNEIKKQFSVNLWTYHMFAKFHVRYPKSYVILKLEYRLFVELINLVGNRVIDVRFFLRYSILLQKIINVTDARCTHSTWRTMANDFYLSSLFYQLHQIHLVLYVTQIILLAFCVTLNFVLVLFALLGDTPESNVHFL